MTKVLHSLLEGEGAADVDAEDASGCAWRGGRGQGGSA